MRLCKCCLIWIFVILYCSYISATFAGHEFKLYETPDQVIDFKTIWTKLKMFFVFRWWGTASRRQCSATIFAPSRFYPSSLGRELWTGLRPEAACPPSRPLWATFLPTPQFLPRKFPSPTRSSIGLKEGSAGCGVQQMLTSQKIVEEMTIDKTQAQEESLKLINKYVSFREAFNLSL